MKHRRLITRVCAVVLMLLAALNVKAQDTSDHVLWSYGNGWQERTTTTSVDGKNFWTYLLDDTYYTIRCVLNGVKSVSFRVNGHGYNVYAGNLDQQVTESAYYQRTSSSNDVIIDYTFNSVGTHFIEFRAKSKRALNANASYFVDSNAYVYISSITYEDQTNVVTNNEGIDISYSFSGGTATVTGIVFSAKRVVIPSKVTYGGQTYDVTSIGANVFYGNPKVQSVHIPASITSIGTNAFKDCTNLKKVLLLGNSVPTGLNEAFNAVAGRVTYVGTNEYETYSSVLGDVKVYNQLSSKQEIDGVTYLLDNESAGLDAVDCDYKTTNITVPDVVAVNSKVSLPVKRIKENTFYGHNTMTDFSVGGNVISIGRDAFASCSALKNVTFNVGESSIDLAQKLFVDCPLKTATINRPLNYPSDGSPFYGNTSLADVIFGGNETTIYADEFTGCTALKTLTTFGKMNTIQASAFKNKTLTSASIDGETVNIGNAAFQSCSALASLTFGNKIGNIGNSAFQNCTAMTSVTFGNSFGDIGDDAFNGCSALTSNLRLASAISMNIGARAFKGCSSLTGITLDGKVETAGAEAFMNCSKATNINVNNNVKTLGTAAFMNCTGAKFISVGTGVTEIADKTFMNCSEATSITLNGTLTSIGSQSFESCQKVPQLNIGNALVSVGTRAFRDCQALGSITFPAGVSEISQQVCENCYSLTTATINGDVTIKDAAFRNCRTLNNVTLNRNVSTIGEYAFYNDAALASFSFQQTLTGIGQYAFAYSGLAAVVLPDKITELNAGTFSNTEALKSVELNKVKTIGTDCFAQSGLESLTLHPVLTTISDGAFRGCSSVATLTIEDTKTSLALGQSANDKAAFHDCRLDEVYIGRNLKNNSGAVSPFSGHQTIQNVTIGGDMISIPVSMFRACPNLDVVTLQKNVTTINSHAFAESGVRNVLFSQKVSVIPTYCFNQTTRLTTLAIPSTITAIGEHAFSYSVIETLEIPGSVGAISDYLLYNCQHLQSLTLNEGQTSIGKYAFASSTLPELTVPRTVNSIDNGAFNSCSSLKNIVIADGSSSLNLGYSEADKGLFLGSALENVYIGRNLIYPTASAYGYSPFCGSKTLTEVEVGDMPTEVGDNEFKDCSALKDVVIGNGVTNIGNYSFYRCTSLESFKVGRGIQVLGSEVFSDNKLSDLYCYAQVPPTCGYNALNDIDKLSCTLHIPYGTKAAYKAADQWMLFLDVEEFDATVALSAIEIQSSATLHKGNTLQLTVSAYPTGAIVGTVTWTTSDASVATVTSDGLVTAVGTGVAIITATEESGETSTCRVTVQSLKLSQDELALNVGEIFTLTAEFEPATEEEPSVTWSSSNTSVATVSDGVVTAKAIGSASITATDATGLTATCVLTVSQLQLILNNSSLSMSAGETKKLTAQYNSALASEPSVTWTSSNTFVATVDGNGNVKALATGTATITARDGKKGLTASCEVTITTAPYRMYFEDQTLRKGVVNRIPVLLNNEQPIVSFNCDIVLPSDLSIAKNNKGRLVIEKGERCDETYTITSSEVNGVVRVVCYSSDNTPVDDIDGALFYFSVEVDDDAIDESEYTARITNISMSTTDFVTKTSPDASALFKLAPSVVPGDVNGDGMYNSTDISLTIEYILERDPANGNRLAADVNSDGTINSTDISLIVSYILSGKTAGASKAKMAEKNESVYFAGTETNGISSEWLKIGLPNGENYTSAQFDIRLPEGVEILDARMNGGHQVCFSRLEDGTARILAFSPDNSNFDINDCFELLVSNKVKGSSRMIVENVVVSAKEFDRIDQSALMPLTLVVTPTGISAVERCDEGQTHCYDLNGIHIAKPAKGVYIINGKKVLIK